MMLQKNILLLVLLIGNLAFSQQVESSLLWKVSGNGIKQPSYIFGTFHMMCKDQFQVSKLMQEQLNACKKFYGELDMDDTQLQVKLMREMMLTDGKTIDSYMSPEVFEEFDKQYQAITGVSLNAFKQYKPFASMSLLVLKTITCNATIQPETELLRLAQQNKMEVLGLETVEEQMAAVNTEPIDSQIASIRKMVLNFDSSKLMMQEMTKVYLKNDPEVLYRFMKEKGETSNFESALLIDRNKIWVPKMKLIMKENPAFFAVGAGHLGGESGVLSLLRKEGYLLEPIKY